MENASNIKPLNLLFLSRRLKPFLDTGLETGAIIGETPTSADQIPQPFELIEHIEPFEHHKHHQPHKPLYLTLCSNRNKLLGSYLFFNCFSRA